MFSYFPNTVDFSLGLESGVNKMKQNGPAKSVEHKNFHNFDLLFSLFSPNYDRST